MGFIKNLASENRYEFVDRGDEYKTSNTEFTTINFTLIGWFAPV